MRLEAVRGLLAAPRRGTAGITIQRLTTADHVPVRGVGVSVIDGRGAIAGSVECAPISSHDEAVVVGWVLEFAMHSGAAVRRVWRCRELERWDQRYRFGIPYRSLGVRRWLPAVRQAGFSVTHGDGAVQLRVAEAMGCAGSHVRLRRAPRAHPVRIRASQEGLELDEGPTAPALKFDPEQVTGMCYSLGGTEASTACGCLTLLTVDGPLLVALPPAIVADGAALALKHLLTSAMLGVA